MDHRLGILDWGIGGLDLYRRLRDAGSRRDVIYWSDAGAPPYGTLPGPVLAERVATVLEHLADEGCREVVIACNAASTVLSDGALRRRADARGLTVLGVIEPALEAVRRLGLREVAVIGGRRTIESRAYAEPLEASGCRVTQRVAQPLSALIERGITEGDDLHACLAEILDPLHDAESLVIACTHYVAALPAIRSHLPRLRRVVDPAAETTEALLRLHHARGLGSSHGHGTARFVTTGSPTDTQRAAKRAFGIALPAVEPVNR
ncbi:glutamate racemase [Paraliomyxa miuraensis]|uniref:glutamate racemase n=1 Tax=Paraliomyxa miuraensis TaxID=376150 RepID=UPI0022566802|nr:aspartate/glutamate racemase family protein [Paraliomyxa miuraensis]MCX4246037.1 aspartate/glutamate racemase family protein [Paraliomyxa miuraensis]